MSAIKYQIIRNDYSKEGFVDEVLGVIYDKEMASVVIVCLNEQKYLNDEGYVYDYNEVVE